MSEKLTMTRYFEARRELIFADRPADITRLEKLIEETQADVVNDLIENSRWSQDLPDFVGGRGTPTERRHALRAAFLASCQTPGTG
jgi:hypothetical protein